MRVVWNWLREILREKLAKRNKDNDLFLIYYYIYNYYLIHMEDLIS